MRDTVQRGDRKMTSTHTHLCCRSRPLKRLHRSCRSAQRMRQRERAPETAKTLPPMLHCVEHMSVHACGMDRQMPVLTWESSADSDPHFTARCGAMTRCDPHAAVGLPTAQGHGSANYGCPHPRRRLFISPARASPSLPPPSSRGTCIFFLASN